jgi:hypothetical protein
MTQTNWRCAGGGAAVRVAVAVVLLAVTGLTAPVRLVSQEPAADSMALPDFGGGVEPADVMILGLFHFHNPNADYAQFEGIDVLTPERQEEIRAVADRLAEFAPTRIAIEKPPSERAEIDANYERYLAGEFELTRNETHQLGFRLAARLGHDRLYPVDYRQGLPIDSVMAYSAAHGGEFARRFEQTIGEVVELLDRMQREETIGANLRFMNRADVLDLAQSPYSSMAAVGVGDTYIGARAATEWYERNLYIFANLTEVATPGSRVLLLIGQGHAPILRELVRTDPRMRLVEPLDYLE